MGWALKAGLHVLIATTAFLVALEIAFGRYDVEWLGPHWPEAIRLAFVYGGIAAIVELSFRIERHSWRFTSLREVGWILRSATVTAVAFLALYFVVARAYGLPRSVFVLAWLLHFFGVSFARALWRVRFEGLRVFSTSGSRWPASSPRAVIVGTAGPADGFLRYLESSVDHSFRPIGIISPDRNDLGLVIRDVPVIATTKDLSSMRASGSPQRLKEARVMIFLSDPNELPGVDTAMLGWLSENGVRFLRPPTALELTAYGSPVAAAKEIAFEELLSRAPVSLDHGPIYDLLRDKVVLITGAAGSIGSELARQAARAGCAELHLLDVSESGLFEIARELRSAASHCEIFEILCDIRDQAAVARAFARSGPQLVFHAAALKHVAMQERHPCEAVLTNVLGTANVLTSSGSAEQLVLISTDKAVAPSSVMGATKRLAEAQLLSAANTNARSLTTVRFGNVLGSAGSVVPIFRKQIEQGGPVTVTDSAMERYFMTIPEAVQLVLYSAALADAEKGANRLFVLEMGEPVRIIELARRMIALMGMRPDVDVPIEVIGRKPGEKLTEELVDEDEIAAPFCQGILEVRRPHECALLGHAELAELIDSASNGGNERTRQLLFQAVAALRQRQVRRQRA